MSCTDQSGGILKFRYKDEKKVNFFQKNCILLIFLPFFTLLREGA